jgi:hypothetical protein
MFDGDENDYDDDAGPEEQYDPTDDCGRWENGRLRPAYYCGLAGTEFCDFECPLRHDAL